MSSTPSLLDSIRRTIEERNLFSARSRLHFVSALKSANFGSNSNTPAGNGKKGSRNFKTPTTGNPMDNRLIRMRKKVIEEIIKTEEIYVNQLKTIRDEFMEDTEIKISFSRRDFNVIFSNIPILLEVNQRLHLELKSSDSSRDGFEDVENDQDEMEMTGTLKSVAGAFCNYTPYLKLYSTYASGYQQADNLLQKLINQCPDLRELIKAKEEKLNNTLQSYLITPIQRIPRYKLLLQQLIGFIGSSGKNDPDFQSLLESIKNLEQVALHMNEMIRQHEDSCKLLELNKWMGKYYHGNLVEPGRYFIKAGTVLKPPTSVLQHSLTSNNQFYLVLLSDQLISCKIKSELGNRGCLQPNLVIPLKKCSARIVDDLFAEVECEEEFVRFTLTDPDDLIAWVAGVNDAAKSLRKRSATLKKPSSNAQPMRREEIKNIIRANKRGVKRPASQSHSPAPSPGKLRRFFNISGRLDELVDYLSPVKLSPQKQQQRRIDEGRFKNLQSPERATVWESEEKYDAEVKFMPASRYPNTSCIIL